MMIEYRKRIHLRLETIRQQHRMKIVYQLRPIYLQKSCRLVVVVRLHTWLHFRGQSRSKRHKCTKSKREIEITI